MSVRVRFAPSPTGFLHVGGARTAIFNWLYATRHGGTFVLRIEDTDAQRSSDEMVQAILDGLAWLGIAPDEGPHFQSQSREQHVRDAHTLIESGAAYRCFCTAESLKLQREMMEKKGGGYVYPGTCRQIPRDESDALVENDEPFTVRFKVPEGEVIWNDLIHGKTRFDNKVIDDFVILRTDATPTYMLSVVSDDIAMKISHVIRGDDHLSNTPKQILLYEALGEALPAFAHLPLILGPDKKRLSKRHAAVSVLEYRGAGMLPDAVFNYLTLLGWSPGDDRQQLDRETLIETFELDGVGKSGAVFDMTKLEWLNGQYIDRLSLDEFAIHVKPWLQRDGLWRDEFVDEEAVEYRQFLALLKPRTRTLATVGEAGRWYLDPNDPEDYDEKPARKHLKGEDLEDRLSALNDGLDAMTKWDAEALESSVRALAEERQLSAAKLIHPLRLAVTGRGESPGIFEVLELLGQTTTLRRFTKLMEYARRRP
ncbi:MAG: glutamate--tRNA ligase, partial [Acidobacteriota bacterium]|nr:glutamate--tRNA ligase [Acidobacteriota bacterium]